MSEIKEEVVTIVQIKGKGAGAETMCTIPKRTWDRIQKEYNDAKERGVKPELLLKRFPEAVNFVVVDNPDDVSTMMPKPQLSPDEIIKQAKARMKTAQTVKNEDEFNEDETPGKLNEGEKGNANDGGEDNCDAETKKFNDLVAKAENLFVSGQFEEAKNIYKEASKLKPEVTYVKDQIRACKQKLKTA